jgi:hypothetical protein
MTNLAVVQTHSTAPPPRSPERAVLAQAIAKYGKIEAEIEAARRAEQVNLDASIVARREVEAAAKAAEDIPEFAVTAAAAAAGASAIRAARHRLADAEDTLAQLLRSRPVIENELRVAEGRLSVSALTLNDAARAVVVAELRVDDLIDRAVAQADALDATRTILELARSCAPRGSFAEKRIDRALAPRSSVDGVTHSTVAPLREALDALKADADAVLPQVK